MLPQTQVGSSTPLTPGGEVEDVLRELLADLKGRPLAAHFNQSGMFIPQWSGSVWGEGAVGLIWRSHPHPTCRPFSVVNPIDWR